MTTPLSFIIADIVEKFGSATPLHEIPDSAFETDGHFSTFLRVLSDPDARARNVIDENNDWRLTVADWIRSHVESSVQFAIENAEMSA